MNRLLVKKIANIAVLLSLLFSTFNYSILIADASDNTPGGQQYKFDSDSKYAIKDASSKSKINGKTQFGEIKLNGNLNRLSDKDGFKAYEVSSGTISIEYNIDVNEKLDISNDKTKKVSNAELDENVLSGAVIIQTSQDGENWIVDKAYTDVLNKEGKYQSNIYESNYVQQANGCYFRILIAYQTEKLIEEKNVLFVDTSDYEKTRWLEVYKFYIVDKEQGLANSVNTTPRTVFQDSKYRKKVKKDGYTGEVKEDVDDPHFGWNLGDFTINGYTAKDDDKDETPVFLKNVGDQVTLWFTLNQDINKLNNDKDLFINADTKAWDERFEIPKTNFKKGTLIIQQTDAEGAEGDPVIFTNYLEANVRTGADTKVKLFEEGDYEVALDYEIKDTSSVVNSTSNYRVSFKFKIRNSNCNIFLFDTVTQSELSDRSNTENGFRLDYANSKYLDVYVEQKAIHFNGTSYSVDTRGNKSAKNGSEYTEEGIYEISIQHDYNNNRTTEKTIFVGSSPIIKALSKNNITIADINNFLAQGYKIDNEGSLVSNTGEELETGDIESTEDIVEADITSSVIEAPATEEESQKVDNAVSEETTSIKSSGPSIMIISIIVLIAAGLIFVFIRKNKR